MLPNNSYYPTANVGLCLMPPARYRERHATRTLRSTQPTKIKLIFSSIRGGVEPLLFSDKIEKEVGYLSL